MAPGEGPSVWALQGDKYTVKAGKGTTGPGFTLLEGEIAPDNGPPMHIHNDADEIFYLLDGELTVASGEEVIKAESGAFIFIPRGAIAITTAALGAESLRVGEIVDTQAGLWFVVWMP
ncbi:cupin domain-containing protein, partial [Streptomyces anulatus]|uniref:cupin domain-containing protein n=1 Tax=Streptomyces anulatus TaxID=1892 RepID=UPI00331CC857